jgi:arylsulfatase A-like enzyme
MDYSIPSGERSLHLSILLLVIFMVGACADPDSRDSSHASYTPTRGFILVSLDTLGADHLGAYGYDRETSPFFDSLAARGVLFENVFVQWPSTLVSHVSMFTGLEPREHGVFAPSSVLSLDIETLPERFRRHGFRTAGHTEGGYVCEDLGFDRGFDEFKARHVQADTDIELTLRRGLDFLRGLGQDERFFLFLHTYAVHDPYDPPERYRSLFAQPSADDEHPDSDGGFLRDVNMGRHTISAETLTHYRAMYDATIRYLDDMLEDFFAELESLRLLEDTTIVLTSDHGEEFMEHGKLAHSQVYAETLRVPLVILHPDQRPGMRVPDLARSIDIAPTLYDLARIPLPEPISGRSLVPLMRGDLALPPVQVHAEMVDQERQRTLLHREEGAIFQYVAAEPISEPGGTWITRSVTFDTGEDRLEVELVSFNESRTVQVSVDGTAVDSLELRPEWTPAVLHLPAAPGKRAVRLSTESCSVPLWLGLGNDTRCLSFKIRGVSLLRSELWDLSRNPSAREETSARLPELHRRLAESLTSTRWTLVAQPGKRVPRSETEEALRALGYL